jgi:hypothetical protein
MCVGGGFVCVCACICTVQALLYKLLDFVPFDPKRTFRALAILWQLSEDPHCAGPTAHLVSHLLFFQRVCLAPQAALCPALATFLTLGANLQEDKEAKTMVLISLGKQAGCWAALLRTLKNVQTLLGEVSSALLQEEADKATAHELLWPLLNCREHVFGL